MLYAQDSIAKQQLDTQAATVAQDQATLKSDQAQIESAKLKLTYAASPRPPPAGSACGRWTSATSCTPATPTASW